MTALVQYAAAVHALAEAKSFDAVKAVRDEMEHVKLYGKQVRDRRLIAIATEMQTRAERRLGELIGDAKKAGWISRGNRAQANVPTPEHFTLEEAGIDRKLSSRAQQLAQIPADKFEAAIVEIRENIAAGTAAVVNGARAVLAGRQQPAGDLDFAPTGPWITRALMERVLPQIPDVDFGIREQVAWEPACGEGHMAEVLGEYFGTVLSSDVHDYGYGERHDFLADKPPFDADWIITNPPFDDKAEQFALRALKLAAVGVAIIVQLRWLEGVGRYDRLFRDQPPTQLAIFVERAPIHMGRYEPDGATLTAYCWLVWVKGQKPRAPFWIPPGCRQQLTKPDDAERFTAHPVIRSLQTKKLPPALEGDGLDIPGFLRRTV